MRRLLVVVSAHRAIAWIGTPRAPSGFKEFGWNIFRIGMAAPIGAEVAIKRGSKESGTDDHYDYLNQIISANGVSGGKMKRTIIAMLCVLLLLVLVLVLVVLGRGEGVCVAEAVRAVEAVEAVEEAEVITVVDVMARAA